MRVFVGDQSEEITKYLNLYEGLEVAASANLRFVLCIVIAGISEGLAGSRVLERARCRFFGIE